MRLFKHSSQTTETIAMYPGLQSRRTAGAASHCQNLLGSL